jgi:hypothetical protein
LSPRAMLVLFFQQVSSGVIHIMSMSGVMKADCSRLVRSSSNPSRS